MGSRVLGEYSIKFGGKGYLVVGLTFGAEMTLLTKGIGNVEWDEIVTGLGGC